MSEIAHILYLIAHVLKRLYRKRGVLRYLSPVSGRMATIIFHYFLLFERAREGMKLVSAKKYCQRLVYYTRKAEGHSLLITQSLHEGR